VSYSELNPGCFAPSDDSVCHSHFAYTHSYQLLKICTLKKLLFSSVQLVRLLAENCFLIVGCPPVRQAGSSSASWRIHASLCFLKNMLGS
jgi:hypothetical protein